MSDNMRGILLMMVSMAGFAMEDMFAIKLGGYMPAMEILVLLGIVGTTIFTLILRRKGLCFWSKDMLCPPLLVRNLAEVLGSICFITALMTIKMSLTTAIFQATPLAVTLGAALFLGEKVGWRRWSAIFVGFIGVIIIIRPTGAGFDMNTIWAVLAVVFLSARDVSTRLVPRHIRSEQVTVWAFFALLVGCSPLLLVTEGVVMPPFATLGYLAGTIVFGMAAYWGLTLSTRMGEASVITPFRYSRLIFAGIIGFVAFSEWPDHYTLLGAGLIVASGIYSLMREHLRKRAFSL